MEIVSLKYEANNPAVLVKIGLSDNTSLIIKNSYLVEEDSSTPETAFPLQVGQELSPTEEEALRFAADCLRTERIGMRLISRAEQTEARLSYKLQGRGCPAACIRAVMSQFVESDLVNDERYAERWLRSRLDRQGGKVSGPRKLSAALRSRGIDRNTIKEALDKALDEETEYALLLRFLAKNRKSTDDRYLRGQLRQEGYSSQTINRYFDEITQ